MNNSGHIPSPMGSEDLLLLIHSMRETEALSKNTVLIIDNDLRLRATLSEVLECEGFSILQAGSGQAALKTFKTHPPDAVLLDLNMSDMNGIDILQQLHTTDPSVPIIILTGYGSTPMAVEAVKCGAYDFIDKPDFIKLVKTLREAVDKKLQMPHIRSKRRDALELPE